jgi:hypothetical protein
VETLGKLLMVMAGVVFLAGGLVYLLGRAGGGFLPGDVVFRRGNVTFLFPVVSMIVISVVLTIVLNLFFRR